MRPFGLVVAACAVAASLVLLFAPAAQTEDPVPVAAVPVTKTDPKAVVRSRLVHPRRVLVLRSKFTPWAQPSVAQVFTIIREESRTQGVSESFMRARIGCESGFQWDNSYIGHLGLGQFLGETWGRAISDMPRRVRFVMRRLRARAVMRFERLADGTLRREARWKVRQRVVHVRVGLLPRHPGILHGWAQVRAVARAIAGRGRVSSSEWTCPL